MLSALGDPTRRSAYDYVSAQRRPVGRDEVATALGIGRSLAAYHLDRLAKEGLLSVAYARRSGRTGPGAGGPPSSTSAPSASSRSTSHRATMASRRDCLRTPRRKTSTGNAPRLARRRGRARPRHSRHGPGPARTRPAAARARLRPYEDDAGVMRLRNCPFHAIAQSHPEVVCDMNLSLLGSILAGVYGDVEAQLEPDPGAAAWRSSPPGTPRTRALNDRPHPPSALAEPRRSRTRSAREASPGLATGPHPSPEGCRPGSREPAASTRRPSRRAGRP